MRPVPWKILPVISAEMPFQMALDEILFRRAEEGRAGGPVLRFYFSAGKWITTGFSHKVPRDDADPKVPVCRRLTGGGRVMHGSDTVFSLVARKTDDESFGSVRASYVKIHTALKAAFDALGRPARFYRCTENLPAGPDCFRFPIASDLEVGGVKAAGGAQKRSCGALLHQESVALPKGIAWKPFIEAALAGLASTFQTEMIREDLEPGILEEAGTLAEDNYGGRGPRERGIR